MDRKRLVHRRTHRPLLLCLAPAMERPVRWSGERAFACRVAASCPAAERVDEPLRLRGRS